MNKRSLQAYFRSIKNLVSRGTIESLHLSQVLKNLETPVPKIFDRALFNFTIDFELFWGNGEVNGREHSFERRLQAGKTQSENFWPFVEMLEEIHFPISWALVGKLIDPQAELEKEKSFSPSWATGDWYAVPQAEREDYWRGEEYLKYLKTKLDQYEILSHGYCHIDYSDSSTSPSIAEADLVLAKNLLENYGFKVSGFVYPCNRHGHIEVMWDQGFQIIRGMDSLWYVEKERVTTPIGFWLSPGVMSLKDAKKVIDRGVEKKSFIHPWIHLVECDLKQGDIDNFYRPLFEYVLELQRDKKIENISFQKINEIIQEDYK